MNDPVYGFITFDDELIFRILSHPWYQRLRRIHQLAMAQLVYPGAVHTRLHHSMGAYHLMCQAIVELRSKGFEITIEEEQGAKIAILLHDIGHGPFSHALEHVLIQDVHHEEISILIFEHFNKEYNGELETALAIFKGSYHKKFLHQLISSQLDVDRMDYLTRDSFYSGVTEGVIGYDRIIKMMTVHNNEIVIEEKGIYSIEKFLVARSLMYWQTYLHKTVLTSENMLVKILERARLLAQTSEGAFSASTVLDEFLRTKDSAIFIRNNLDKFCSLDDYDVLSSIKLWCSNSDIVLSTLSSMLINRQLLKTRFQYQPFSTTIKEKLQHQTAEWLNISFEEAGFLVFDGIAENRMYNTGTEQIKILFKDGSVKNISEVEHGLIHVAGKDTVQKFYICAPGEILKKEPTLS